MIQHIPNYLIGFDIDKNSSKWPKKFKIFQMVKKFAKAVKYFPKLSKIISQNDRSWYDSSWGNSS